MGKKSSSAPPPDPLIGQAMMKQMDLAEESVAFFKQVYAESQPRQQALDDLNISLGKDLMSDAATNRARSAEQYQFYMDKGRPVEQKMLEESLSAGSEGERAAARGRAAADVQQSFGNVQQQNMRTMARYGIRPNAERMATIQSQLAAQQAASQAGAMTNADQGAIDRGVAMRANAANVARGMPAQALTFGGAAAGAGQTAFGNQVGANQSSMAFSNQMGSGYGQAGNTYGNVANQGNAQYGNQIQAWQANQQNKANSMAGFGSMVGMGASLFMSSKKMKEGNSPVDDEAALEGIKKTKVQSWRYKEGDGRRQVGPMAEDMQSAFGDSVAPAGQAIDVVSNLGVHHAAIRALAHRLDSVEGSSRTRAAFADGGVIRGPGTGTSDSIPARNTSTGERVQVSNGEFIVPADTVRRIGLDKLERMVAATHKPAQRAAIRR